MNELPRKRIEPLSPPAGELDRVLARARYRRHRRALGLLTVSTVFVAGLGGGFALGRDVPANVARAVSHLTDRVSQLEDPTTTATPTDSAASRTPKERRAKEAAATSSDDSDSDDEVRTRPKPGSLAYHGQALGPAGQPASGLYVYVGVPGADGFRPGGWAVDRTDEQGKFTLSCPHAPVLLAPWPLRGDAKSKARYVAWSATFVGGATDPAVAEEAPCSRHNKVDVTRIGRGSAVEGVVSLPDSCRTETRSLRVWLHNDPETYVKAQDLGDGETFRVSGLPPGEHTLDAKGRLTRVLVGGGTTAHQDISFSCTDLPTVTPTPTATSSTPTGTPEPTDSAPTSTGSPSDTAQPSTTP